MSAAFFGPSMMSGIGQVNVTYANLVHADYIEFGNPVTRAYDVGYAFVIPLPEIIDLMKQYRLSCKKMVYMTVCETETVHPLYESLLELSDTWYTPSNFAANILKRQFPAGNFKVLRHYSPPCTTTPHVIPRIQNLESKYVFYHIGNIIDQRKNIKGVIEAFMNLSLPNSVLLLKATCNQPVHWNIPGVVILEGLMSKEELEYIHKVGDCYVSFSHSEGAGMGAIEAAMRNKTVIIPAYGAGVEYIDTPYVIPCKLKTVGSDDFLFMKDAIWGDPDKASLMNFMKQAYHGKRTPVVSKKTHDLVSQVPVLLTEILFGDE
jgi:hypothetical protein